MLVLVRRRYMLAVLSLCLLFMPAAQAALTDTPVPWSNFSFQDYTFQGSGIFDHESSSDPSHGPAAVQPSAVDISSCSADGSNPGTASSVRIAYHDADGDPGTIGDASVAFRMRLDNTPLEGGQEQGYQSRHWDILIDIDNDGFKEFVVDLRGDHASSKPDRLVLLYNDADTQEVDATNDEIDRWYASGPGATGDAADNNHTRVVEDTSQTCTGDHEFWLDMQVPLTAFDDQGGVQQITPTTPVRIFYSTSASNTNPLQKDWMNDPGDLGDSFTVSDPIVFGDSFSGDGGVEPITNERPDAVDDSATTSTDTAVSIPALDNDSDPDGDDIAIDSVGTPSNGTVSFDPDGTIVYTPNAGFSGTDTFDYTICDTNDNCDTATVTVTVDDDVPNANPDSASTPTDTAVSIPVLANDTDPNDDPLSVQSVTQPNNGSVSFNADGTVIYTPDSGFTGTDSFTYTACDPGGNCDTTTVSVTVDDDTPNVVADSGSTPIGQSVTIPVLVNDTDPDNDTLTIDSVAQPANGSVSVNSDGTITYTPDDGFSGTDTFSYTACDASNNCSSTVVTIVVSDDRPHAVSDRASTPRGAPVTIPVLDNDSDPNGDSLTIEGVTQPANGSITVHANGSITYTPNAGFSGTDTFSYTVCDPNGNCDTATVTLVILQDGVAIQPTKRYKAIVPDPHVRYYITLKNIGSQDQPDNAGPEFEDPLPAGVRYLDGTAEATSGSLHFDANTRTFRWNGTIRSGDSVVVHFTVVVERNGQIADGAIPSIPSDGPWAWLGMGLMIGTVGLWRVRRMPQKRVAATVVFVALGIGLSGCSALLPGGSPVDEICNQGRVHVDPTQNGTNDSTVLTDDPSTPMVGDATCFNVISGLIK